MANIKTIVAVAIIGIVLVLGAVAYSIFRAPAGASGPIQSIPIGTSAGGSASPTAVAPAATAAIDAATPVATDAPATDQPASEGESAGSSGAIIAQIVSDESEARFVIDEVLNNAPKTVIGTTNQVAGEFAVDPSDPARSQIGVIQVNARTLTTDSEFRNRAIKNQILQTDQYEFITFTPKRLVGLPASATTGQSYSFQVVGDLTIRDVTREVTFDVTVTPKSESRLEGTAQTTIRYADYGITIPQVRQVASVDEHVRLELDFVAIPRV
jgi:polyisoprenoid-binding protein YceI